MSDGFTITGCDGHCLANGCARQELRAEIERLRADMDQRMVAYVEAQERDEAEIARLRRELEIWRRNGGDILLRAEIERLQAFIQGCATCKEEWEAERRRNYDEMQRRFRELG